MNDAVPLPPAAKPKTGIFEGFSLGFPSGSFAETALIGLLAGFGGILQLRISRSYSNSLLTAALIYSCLNAVGFSERPPGNSPHVARRALGGVLLLLSLALSFMAFRSAPGTGRPFYSFADMENFFPVIAIVGWWCIAERAAGVAVLLKSLIFIALTVSLWHLVWELPALFIGELLINITIRIASYVVYLAGVDIRRVGEVLSIGTGSVRVYLGCTGFPLFQILVKLMIAEWVVFRKVHLSWRTKTLIAAGVAMVVGIMRLATLAAVAANRTSLHFWHGEGSKLFTAIAVVLFISIVGLRDSYGARTKHTEA
jgi:hypothetical protein